MESASAPAAPTQTRPPDPEGVKLQRAAPRDKGKAKVADEDPVALRTRSRAAERAEVALARQRAERELEDILKTEAYLTAKYAAEAAEEEEAIPRLPDPLLTSAPVGGTVQAGSSGLTAADKAGVQVVGGLFQKPQLRVRVPSSAVEQGATPADMRTRLPAAGGKYPITSAPAVVVSPASSDGGQLSLECSEDELESEGVPVPTVLGRSRRPNAGGAPRVYQEDQPRRSHSPRARSRVPSRRPPDGPPGGSPPGGSPPRGNGG